MKFYGRDDELEIIKNWIKTIDRGTLFTSIIGRRRIGKTRLWLEATQTISNSLYLFCLPGNIGKTFDQVDAYLYELGFTSVPKDLTQFFKAVSVMLSKNQPLIFFFDEVQNLFLDSSEDLFLFQRYIDEFKRKNYPCLIVFCGSIRSLLNKILFEESSPLFGRLDHNIQLNPLPFSIIKQLFIDNNITSPEQHLRLYTMFGANIRFYEILQQFGWLEESISLILKKGWMGFTGLFSDELNKMLHPELKKSSHVYTGMLSSIAKGIQSANEIANVAGINTTSLGNYLPYLTDSLDLIEKEISVTEKANSKNSRYVIKDPFIYFWYRYIEQNRALLEMGQANSVFTRIVEDMPNLEGRVLEMILKQKILENPPMDFDIAGPVFKNKNQIEIDYLLVNEKANRIFAFEFKRGQVNKKRELNKLLYNVSQLHFKSVQLNTPFIEGRILSLKDI